MISTKVKVRNSCAILPQQKLQHTYKSLDTVIGSKIETKESKQGNLVQSRSVAR